MLTIFSVPKSFQKEFSTIQFNAIKSWALFKPKPEIILFGNETGVAEICKKLNLTHFPQIKTNQYQTPLLNDVFDKAQKIAKNSILMYVNSDIIFPQNIMEIVFKISKNFKTFLATGQRFELKIDKIISFSDPRWSKDLTNRCRLENQLRGPGWIDYFIFTKGLFKNIPPFALGRTFWDKWLIWRAISSKYQVIDLSLDVAVIHQSHTYSYNKKDTKWIWEGPEAQENIRLAGGWSHGYSLNETTHIYKNGEITVKKHNPVKQKLVCLFKSGLDKFSRQSLLLKIRYLMNWG